MKKLTMKKSDIMTEHDPDYVDSKINYNRRIATRCRICGHQLLTPEEQKQEMHHKCKKNFKDKDYVM